MRRIADDPDSWGKPADLVKRPIIGDDSSCGECGVKWMLHGPHCPIKPRESTAIDYLGI